MQADRHIRVVRRAGKQHVRVVRRQAGRQVRVVSRAGRQHEVMYIDGQSGRHVRASS